MNSNEISKQFKRTSKLHLVISLVIDFIGMSSYLIPALGELGDFVYAPISGIAILLMYKRRIGVGILGGTIGTIEEILPGTDFVPTATLMWIYTYKISKEKTLKKFAKTAKTDLEIIENA